MLEGPSLLPQIRRAVPSWRLMERSGAVSQVIGLTAEIDGLACAVGEAIEIRAPHRATTVTGQVVGFRGRTAIMMPYTDLAGVTVGNRAVATGTPPSLIVGEGVLGRVLDGLGRPLDGGSVPRGVRLPIAPDDGAAAHPLRRLAIDGPLRTGERVIDGMLTLGRGQRLGIFAGSGVGKSTFLGTLARSTEADVNVICLVGERGREVQEFVERLRAGAEMARTVVVVATSDQPALLRLSAAWAATRIAAYFRDLGRHVLLTMDSVTRFAMAQREIGLAAGEPPASRGYTPSVFALLPRLLEGAGTGERGTVTGLYTVLVDGDDMNEPISDAVRGTLDGHIVLSRQLASAHHYPAVDVLESVSRLMPRLVTAEHLAAAARVRELLAAYRRARDIIQIGAYVAGSDPEVDLAIQRLPHINAFLQQDAREATCWEDMLTVLLKLGAP